MVQVYSAVLSNDQSKVLIARKRIVNHWWGGHPTNMLPVNGAGQWAFPGGKLESESAVEGAKREFTEETGIAREYIDKNFLPNPRELNKDGYKLVVFVLSQGCDINNLCELINKNIAPDPIMSIIVKMGVPNYTDLNDWELGEAIVVQRNVLSNYLGKWVEFQDYWFSSLVSFRFFYGRPEEEGKTDFLKWYSRTQAIDWYAEMAKTIEKL